MTFQTSLKSAKAFNSFRVFTRLTTSHSKNQQQQQQQPLILYKVEVELKKSSFLWLKFKNFYPKDHSVIDEEKRSTNIDNKLKRFTRPNNKKNRELLYLTENDDNNVITYRDKRTEKLSKFAKYENIIKPAVAERSRIFIVIAENYFK